MTAAPDLELVIGNKNLSSWSLRPWLLMKHAEIPFRERVVLFENESFRDEIASLSPSRRVPVLRAGGGLVVWDSLAICEHVAELFPSANLWPEDPTERALARAVSAEMHSGFSSMRSAMSMDVVARHPPATMSTETEEDVRRVQAIWSECRARAAGRPGAGPFLFGSFSIADAMFAPVVWRFRTYGVTLGGGDDLARAYYETMLSLPAMKTWERDAEAEVAASRARAATRTGPLRGPAPRSAQQCYAVVFTARLKTVPPSAAYQEAAEAMVALAKTQPGFLGIDSARNADGFGISVSYWDSLEAIRAWKDVPAHRAVQERGREELYTAYEVRVCTVDRSYKFGDLS